MQSEKSMCEYYAARAQEYDAIYQKPERQADLRIIEDWIPQILSGRRVLEIACGTGYWTQFIAPKAAQVVAIDAAQETLEIAKQRENTKKVDFRIADAYALPDQLGSFDAAFAGFWFSHIPLQRVRPFLIDLHKKLMPGAIVLFLDNLYVEGNSTPIGESDKEENTYQIRKLRDGTSHRVLKNFPSEEELKKMIEGIGGEAQYHRFNYYWTFSYKTLP
ncbi:MAG: class I SAM-dependent methyltransferase [Bdellovibrionales bacterium]|jgi:demethylmenaquinone methyltransferase/2-methoxy-6-polyprenyl-1,4-benzoquinol methylase